MARKPHPRPGGTAASAAPGPRFSAPRWVDPAVLLLAFGAFAATSWNRWADPFIDFGRELYVAWRLSEGAALYRDLAYFNGPLSPHWNAALFRLFGVSTGTLYAANLAVVFAIAALLHRGLDRIAGRLAALLGTLSFLSLFAFGQLLTVASFNFIAPYSHEATHGTFLSLLALAGLFVWLERGGARAAFACGIALGLVLLTKPEFPVAVAGAIFAALGAAAASRHRSFAEVGRGAAWMGLGFALPPLAAWLALRGASGEAAASEALLGTWRHVANPGVRALDFYRQGMGIDAPLRNTLSAAAWLAGSALALAVGSWLARRVGGRGGVAKTVGFLVVPGALLLAGSSRLDWTGFARPLPWVLLGVAVWQFTRLTAARSTGRAVEARELETFAAVIFAGLLLLKMALNARFYQYGFALAMPGAVLIVAGLVGELPSRLFRDPTARRLFVGWTASLVAAVLAIHVGFSVRVWRGQQVEFSAGGDRIVGDAQARFLSMLLERLDARLEPGATLAVLPEGVMVNYLARRVNPTPYVNFMPPELLMFGEQRILASFRSQPPDNLLLTNRDAADYGLGLLGVDHGRDLMGWVQASYELVETIREPTSAGRYFSYGLVLRRRPSVATSGTGLAPAAAQRGAEPETARPAS